jgi:hypothetical protein
MSCGNSRSSKCNPCGPSEAAMNAIADRAAYYARIAIEAVNQATTEPETWEYVSDGTQTTFNISEGISQVSGGYIVHIDGVYQKPSNYSINNTAPKTLIMSTPVPAGSEITITTH